MLKIYKILKIKLVCRFYSLILIINFKIIKMSFELPKLGYAYDALETNYRCSNNGNTLHKAPPGLCR